MNQDQTRARALSKQQKSVANKASDLLSDWNYQDDI